jgi:DNA-binding response OmpR family regulator
VGAGVDEKLLHLVPDCLVVDLRMDAALGVLRWYTRNVSRAVIVVTDLAGTDARLCAIECGVADHVVAPFSAEELVARVLSILVRRRVPASTLEIGDLRVDPGQRLVTRGDARVSLTARELDVLLALMRNRARVMSKQELLESVWGSNAPTANTVEATISSLRRKLHSTGAPVIHTVHRSGYVFRPPVPARISRIALVAQRDRLLHERDEAIARRDEIIGRLQRQLEAGRRAGEASRPSSLDGQ